MNELMTDMNLAEKLLLVRFKRLMIFLQSISYLIFFAMMSTIHLMTA